MATQLVILERIDLSQGGVRLEFPPISDGEALYISSIQRSKVLSISE